MLLVGRIPAAGMSFLQLISEEAFWLLDTSGAACEVYCRMVLLPMQYMLTASPRSACYLWVVHNSKTCQEFLIELVVKLLNTFGRLSRRGASPCA